MCFAMNTRRRPAAAGRGFTLIEMLVVLAIIAVLVALLMPVLAKARRMSRMTQCKSNLQQIGTALKQYQNEYTVDVWPARLTHLSGQLQQDKIFLCPADGSMGTEGGKPASVPADQQFPEMYEKGTEPGTKPCSYMYEFNGAPCSWAATNQIWARRDPATGQDLYGCTPQDIDSSASSWTDVSWAEVKIRQLKVGDVWLHAKVKAKVGYPKSKFPLIRCWWHMEKPTDQSEMNVINLSVEKRPFMSGPKWEEYAIEN